MTAMLALLYVALPAAASGGACPPAAHLDGAHRLIGLVSQILRAHGVVIDPAACSDATVRVSIEAPRRGAPLMLHIRDRFGRASEREVADVDTAASLIETWALQEDQALVTPPVLTVAPTVVAAPPDAARDAWGWALLASAETAAASDGSLWYGATVSGCGRIGALCVGGRARLERDSGAGGPPDDRVYSRTDLDVLATVGTTLGHARMTVSPALGIGVGRWSASRPPIGAPNVVSSTSEGLRGEAGVIAAFALARHWSIFIEGNAMLARLGDPGAGQAALSSPAAFFRAGLGVRVTP